MKNKLPDIILIFVFIGVLTLSLVKTAFFPKEINSYENRPANKLPQITAQSVLDGKYQDSVDKALSDQVFFSESMKSAYNTAESALIKFLTSPFKKAQRGKYMKFGPMQLFDGDYFCAFPYSVTDEKLGFLPKADAKTENINELVKENPDLKFYGYYVEKDIDISLDTNQKTGNFDVIKSKLNIENFEKFSVNTAEDYKNYFYKTDHHWNKDGSYKAYTELLSLVGVSEAPLAPKETKTLTNKFSGAYAKGKGISGYNEKLEVNIFDYAPKEIYINGEKAEKYGHSDEDFTYGGWYGLDKGEIVFKNNAPEKENILIIGDSYDNAVIELMSAHFNNLHSVDIRYNQNFDFNSYVLQNEIDKVLFIGCLDFYTEDKKI